MNPVEPGRPTVGRLDADPPPTGERFDALLDRADARIVHIVSTPSADDTVYDQDDDELVLLLDGGATLEIDGAPHDLEPGTFAWLPAHTPHRVTRCEPGTRWLAVHLSPEGR